MKLYSLNYDGYGYSYHTVANSREEAFEIISKFDRYVSDIGNNTPKIYESFEDCRNVRGNYVYYWEERDIGKVLVTERS